MRKMAFLNRDNSCPLTVSDCKQDFRNRTIHQIANDYYSVASGKYLSLTLFLFIKDLLLCFVFLLSHPIFVSLHHNIWVNRLFIFIITIIIIISIIILVFIFHFVLLQPLLFLLSFKLSLLLLLHIIVAFHRIAFLFLPFPLSFVFVAFQTNIVTWHLKSPPIKTKLRSHAQGASSLIGKT